MKHLGWVCAAYGVEKVGLCFFEEIRGDQCGDQHTCEHRLQVHQSEMYHQIRILAATGDPVWREMAAGIDGPEAAW